MKYSRESVSAVLHQGRGVREDTDPLPIQPATKETIDELVRLNQWSGTLSRVRLYLLTLPDRELPGVDKARVERVARAMLGVTHEVAAVVKRGEQ